MKTTLEYVDLHPHYYYFFLLFLGMYLSFVANIIIINPGGPAAGSCALSATTQA